MKHDKAHIRRGAGRVFAAFAAALFLSLAGASACVAANEEGKKYYVRFVQLIKARDSGFSLQNLSGLYMDRKNSELYALDFGNDRVVILGIDGTSIYSFKLFHKLNSPGCIAADGKGKIYVAGEKIAVYDYRGEFIEYLDLPVETGLRGGFFQALAFDDLDNMYIGGVSSAEDGNVHRIAVLNSRRKFVSKIDSNNRFLNTFGLMGDNGDVAFVDTALFNVWKLDKDGNELMRFGAVSSLLGGFSQPMGFSVMEDGRIVVSDINRRVVILFTAKGDPIMEFGGPNVFAAPSRVATLGNFIYVADSGGVVIFEVVDISERPISPEESQMFVPSRIE